MLEDEEEALEDLKDIKNEAEALMNRYNFDTEDENADIPWDWTQELADQYTDEFYAAKDEWQRKKKEVDEIKKIKDDFDAEEAKENAKLLEEA